MKSPLIAVLALSLLGLAGCSTTPSQVCVQRPPIPANLLAPCQRPTPILTGSFPEVASKVVEVSARLYECAAQVDALRKLLEPEKK